ncbi:MAG: glycosyl transferase [Gammaproteobacteria bacterium]|jgi:glycosyltransferase involved in cell wall biosynthesis|nr:glycosyl transferase [Gammaproteobacteria bacterium]
MLAPIVIFAYNRPSHLKQTITALLANPLAKESEVFIYSDAAKTSNDQTKVNEVRAYIDSITGFKSLKLIKQSHNLGLASSIISGVTEIVNQFGKVIVLEDDMITSPYFLTYMNQALNLYEHDAVVASIHGYVYPTKENLPDTFFIKGADCWGWATWKRAWDTFEVDGKKLLKAIDERGLKSEFNFDNSYDYYWMLVQQIMGKNNSWAVRWHASCLLNGMLTLYPGKTLVNNIGFDGSGEHCADKDIFSSELSEYIYLQKIELHENKQAKAELAKFLEQLDPFWKRCLKKVLGSFMAKSIRKKA